MRVVRFDPKTNGSLNNSYYVLDKIGLKLNQISKQTISFSDNNLIQRLETIKENFWSDSAVPVSFTKLPVLNFYFGHCNSQSASTRNALFLQ